jgi:hypothetical protein
MCNIMLSIVYDGCKDGCVGEDGWVVVKKVVRIWESSMVAWMCLCLCQALVKSTANVSIVFSMCVLRCFGMDSGTGNKTGSENICYISS